MVKNDDASMVYSFDAIRGVQAGREFYVAMCPLKTIPKLFIFTDSELPSAASCTTIVKSI